MKIAVVGLGGVGGYITASFAKNGIDVVGFAKGNHLIEIQKNGISIEEDEEVWVQSIEANHIDNFDGYFDIVIFCVKSYDLENSYKSISSSIDENSILVSFANGVDNGDKLRRLSNSKVLDGAIYILSHIKAPATIRKKGKVFSAVFGGTQEETKKLASLFEQANLRYKVSQNIKYDLWKKYIFISTFATLTSYYNKSIGAIYQEHLDDIKQLLKEVADVAKVHNVDIDAEIEKSILTASKVPNNSSTSMHKDFKDKKQVELDSLSGFIANTKGVKTPLMKRLYEELKNGK